MQTLIEKIIQLAIEIQQIPAPTFSESKRADFLHNRYLAEGLADVEIDEVGNVYGRIKGLDADAAPLVICAHLDTVFPAETDLRIERDLYRVVGPGIGDNSLGVAGMLGLRWLLTDQKTSLRGDIWLVDRFEAVPIAYLAIEGMALGYIYNRALGVRRYRISATTEGGHSWGHFGRPSAIHTLAKLIDRLTAIPLPRKPRTTLNIGTFAGGTSINTIAADAAFELDLRSEAPEALADVIKSVHQLVEAANKPEVRVVAEQIGNRPAGRVSTIHPIVELAKKALIHTEMEPMLTIGSTDANIPLSRGYPAICLGITTGEGAHTTREFIDTRYIEKGMHQLLYFVNNLWD
jgi:tripeptide aminopeptidase